MNSNRIIIGDSRKLNLIADKEVQLIVTSPPYWQLKDYGSISQIGFHDSYESYINNLNLVWMECYRVLADGCRLCINIGDQFARSVYYGRYKVIPIRTEVIRFCEAIGMDYMGAIIWQKATTMNTTGGGAVMGSFPYPRNGILKIDYEFILLFKKQGKSPEVTADQKKRSEMTREEWNKYFASHWNFAGARQDNHIAMFPEELPRRLIKMFSFADEVVFDPFLGSGTTALAAKNLERRYAGYEINEEFLPVIKEKLGMGDDFLFQQQTAAILKDDAGIGNASFEMLPYRFTDPHKLDSRTDMKKLNFGSKIDAARVALESLPTVTAVLSPNLIQLSTGATVRLTGIQILPETQQEAIDFLIRKTLKKHVHLKFDQRSTDEERHLLAYLYLENKTFVNLHLVRTSLVAVDLSYEYKYLRKFAAAAQQQELDEKNGPMLPPQLSGSICK